MKMQLVETARVLNSSVSIGGDKVITFVVSDPRKATLSSLFIPLAGVGDGHGFVSNAMADGAEATLWKKGHESRPADVPVIEVEDPLAAPQSLTKHYLSKVNPTVVRITDSNGKTTTKDMVTAVLAKRFSVHKTQVNFNNEAGVPVTILETKPPTKILVPEMRMDCPRQLHHLGELVKPGVCVIIMIGETHIGFLGTRDKVADAKMEITDFLKGDGKFIYSGNEPLLEERTVKIEQDKGTFGLRGEDTIFATTFRPYMHHATFEVDGSEQRLKIPMIGKHNVLNAFAAVSVGRHFGESYG